MKGTVRVRSESSLLFNSESYLVVSFFLKTIPESVIPFFLLTLHFWHWCWWVSLQTMKTRCRRPANQNKQIFPQILKMFCIYDYTGVAHKRKNSHRKWKLRLVLELFLQICRTTIVEQKREYWISNPVNKLNFKFGFGSITSLFCLVWSLYTQYLVWSVCIQCSVFICIYHIFII